MLHIHNIRKIQNRKVFARWFVKEINNHPTQRKYMFDIHCVGPLGNTIDRCTISLERNGKMLKTMTHPTTHSYFFNYNGKGTNVCGGAEWLGDMNNFVGQLEYIIKKYHLLT
jgi:hypothetical protein